MKRKDYDAEINMLQGELVEEQAKLIEEGRKVVVVFEGRDTAGKDGVIRRVIEHLNTRTTRVVALPKPTEREQTQWYFQRYVPHLPAAGELTIFNRSWYNRAGVEPVMGFCTPEQHTRHLKDTRRFEHMLFDDEICLIKIWLDVSKEEQAKRLAVRETDPMKRFKMSGIDRQAQDKWDDYTRARDLMLTETDTKYGPWAAVLADSKQQARIQSMRVILSRLGRTDILCDPAYVFARDTTVGFTNLAT